MGDGIATRGGAAGLSGAHVAWREPDTGPPGPGPGSHPGHLGLPGTWTAPDARLRLQLVLAGFWLLDAVLQYQSLMFTRAFARMLGGAAHGNPALVAAPITWSARLVDHHVATMNAMFAAIQLLLALGIAWRPTVRIALGASVIWALAVWWLGEGFGLVLTGNASPVSGAPGAAVLYALLAVLLWPAVRDRPSPFVAGRAVGARAARLAWLVLWGSLGYLALQPAVRTPQALSSAVSGMAAGGPGWLAAVDRHLGGLLSHHSLAASAVLAAVLVAVALGVYLPPPAARVALATAVAAAAAIWIAEGLGGALSGSGTDPNSGPLLALLAVAYWPAPVTDSPAPPAPAAAPAAPVPAGDR